MTAEQQGVSPAAAGGASAPSRQPVPEPFRRMFWTAAEDIANVIGCTVIDGEPRGYGDPEPRDTDPGKLRGIANALHAALGEEDCTERAVTLGHLWYLVRLVSGHLDAISDGNRRRPGLKQPDAEIERLREELDKVSGGWEARVESRQKLVQERDQARAELDRLHASNYADEQLRFDAYAELLNVLDEGWHPPVGTGTFRAVRAAIVKALDLRAQYKTERDEARVERDRLRQRLDQHLADENSAQAAHDRLRADLTRERAVYAGSPDDRLYHAADNTWWRRNDNGWLVEAERPQLADITAERDQLRRKLDQHLADENSAQAVSDRLRQELDLQHADRLRWLCEALNVNPANETWLTAMRRVRHLRQNFSDSPRCEVAESDGWRCRLFAGHDGKHLAQMPTGERREWPFDNRLTPRYWRVGDPEPEIGTTVRYVNHATWPTQTRRTDGQWHCNADTHDPSTCTESELYSWEQITARSELMPLVEVAANSKAGA